MKDPAGLSLIERVLQSFPASAIEMRDNWEVDLTAIGFVRRGTEDRLVYVRVRRDEPDRYAIIREYCDSPEHERNVEVGEREDFAELLRVLSDHLDLPLSP